MSEIGIGLVNAQAAEITELIYPDWAMVPNWVVVGKVGQDTHGYDLYEIRRDLDTLTIPANRLVAMKRLLERCGVQ